MPCYDAFSFVQLSSRSGWCSFVYFTQNTSIYLFNHPSFLFSPLLYTWSIRVSFFCVRVNLLIFTILHYFRFSRCLIILVEINVQIKNIFHIFLTGDRSSLLPAHTLITVMWCPSFSVALGDYLEPCGVVVPRNKGDMPMWIVSRVHGKWVLSSGCRPWRLNLVVQCRKTVNRSHGEAVSLIRS